MKKPLLLNLGLSLLIFLPGLLLSLYSRWLGMAWLLVGSFTMMARSYRREWRLTPWSIVLPPAATGASFLVQLLLMRLAPYPILLFLALAVGGALGLFRGRAHQVYRREDGVFARRTLSYLLAWLLAYLATQGFSMARLQGVAAVANAGGAFTLAMLGGVSLVLLFKYRQQRQAPGRPAAGLGISGLLILPVALLLGLSITGVARGQEPDEELLDRAFNSPQYLIFWTGVNTASGFQEKEAYIFFNVPPEEGRFAVPDGSGGVYINTGDLVGGPYRNRREACAAAAGVGQNTLLFIIDNSSFACSAVSTAAGSEAGAEDVAITATTWISSVAMVLAGAAGNVLTSLSAAGSTGSAGPTTAQAAQASTGPTMVDDTRVVGGREAIEVLVRHGAVKEGECVREDSIQNLPPAITAIAYRANTQGLVCPDDISVSTLWRHPDHDPEELVIAPGEDLATRLGDAGFSPRFVTDRDGRQWIQAPENTPDNVAGLGHVTRTVIDGYGRQAPVIDPTAPVIIQHWPSMRPAKAPAQPVFQESDLDGISPFDDEPTLMGGDLDGIPPFDEEPELEPGALDEIPPFEDVDPTVVATIQRDQPPPAEKPALPWHGVDRVLVERAVNKVKDIYDQAGDAGDTLGDYLGEFGDALGDAAGEFAQEQIKDMLRKGGLPERFMPDRLNQEAIDEIEKALETVDEERLRRALERARQLLAPDSKERTVAESVVGKESVDDLAGLLDEIDARLPEAKTPPADVPEPEAGHAPASPISQLTPTMLQPQAAVQNIADAFRDAIPAERLGQLQATSVQSRSMTEVGQILGGSDELDKHTRAFVRRIPGQAPEIVINQDVADAGDMMHEMVHVASNPGFGPTFGKQFNEAVTEYFSRPLSDRYGIDRSAIMYNSRGGTAMVQKLVDLVGEDQLKQAYFSDDPIAAETLKRAIDARLGPGKSDLIRRMTEQNPRYPNYDVAAKVLAGEFEAGIAAEDLADG